MAYWRYWKTKKIELFEGFWAKNQAEIKLAKYQIVESATNVGQLQKLTKNIQALKMHYLV